MRLTATHTETLEAFAIVADDPHAAASELAKQMGIRTTVGGQ